MANSASHRPGTNLPEKGHPPAAPEPDIILDDEDDDEDLDLWPKQRHLERGGRAGIRRERDPSRDRDAYRTNALYTMFIDKHR